MAKPGYEEVSQAEAFAAAARAACAGKYDGDCSLSENHRCGFCNPPTERALI